MRADEIRHDKKKRTIYYKNAKLKIYDKNVFYFPKFFHPDPTVERQTGFLIPRLQDNSATGLSLNLPYFLAIAKNKDMTLNQKTIVRDEPKHGRNEIIKITNGHETKEMKYKKAKDLIESGDWRIL